MEQIEIKYKPSVEKYLNDLVDILFEEEYFGFIESAQKYIRDVIDSAEYSMLNYNPRNTPTKLLKYGEFYISYPSNNKTTWYIFFSKFEHQILVKYITNIHVVDARFLEHF